MCEMRGFAYIRIQIQLRETLNLHFGFTKIQHSCLTFASVSSLQSQVEWASEKNDSKFKNWYLSTLKYKIKVIN